MLNNRNKVLDLQKKFGGSKVRKEIGEENEYPTVWSYLWSVSSGATQHMDQQNYIKRIWILLIKCYWTLK